MTLCVNANSFLLFFCIMWTETTRIIMRFDRSRIDAYSIFWTSVDRLLDTIIKPLRYNFCTYILLLVLFYILMLTSFVYLYIYLFIYLYIYQEPTDIPSRKKLMRWVCARGWCVRRGSLL